MISSNRSLDSSLPLSPHHLMSTDRADQAEHVIACLGIPIRITGVAEPQQFGLTMNGVHRKRLSLGFNQFSTDTDVKLDSEAGRDIVGITLGSSAANPSYLEIDGERVSVSARTAAAILSPAREVRINRPGRSGLFALTVPVSILAERYEEIFGHPVERPIKYKPALDLTKGSGQVLQRLVNSLATMLDHDSDGADTTLITSTLEDAIISVTLGLADVIVPDLAGENQRDFAPKIVRRAEDYMATHAGDPITLSDLVAICGCSRSTLYNTFRTSRGYAPMEFLAARRLEFARKRLMRQPDATVTQIALECGFSNLGRFAKAYRKRFGELPSVTHARRHRRIGCGGDGHR